MNIRWKQCLINAEVEVHRAMFLMNSDSKHLTDEMKSPDKIRLHIEAAIKDLQEANLNLMKDISIIINVRYGNGTYTARAKGMNKTASYTGSAEGAVDTLAKKLLGDKPFTKMQYSFTCSVNNGDSNTWIVEAK